VIAQSSSDGVLAFIDESPLMIIKTIEAETDIEFNYIFDKLPKRKFTFSLDRSDPDLEETLSLVLGRSITKVSDGVYAVGSKDLTGFDEHPKPISKAIFDAETGEPVIGATVRLSSLDYGVVTDIDGIFIVDGYFAESDIVEIQYLGYDTRSLTIAQLRNSSAISIAAKEHVLDDIVIKSSRRISTTRLNGDVIDPESVHLPSSPDRDAFSQAQMIPGVYNSSESLQDLQIRGGPPDQVSYNWNNMRLFQNSLF